MRGATCGAWLLLFAGGASAWASPRSAETSSPLRIVSADVARVRGPLSTVFRECIGAGRANEGLRADWQEQLALVQREIGFRYIRMHGLFHDDMGVYSEDRQGRPVHNWQYVDVLHDALLRLGLRPFVELSFMPAALASGPQTIFWWKGNVTPPRSYERWAELVADLARHSQERYGHDEVRRWYFEVWNEPDLKPFFFTGDLADYLRLYDVTARAIKGVSPDYRVGGPASASAFAFEQALVEHCVKNQVPLDFVSTHCYGVKEGYLDETGRKGTVLDPDKTAVRSRMLHSRELIAASARPDLELHFTEWSSSYTPSDPIHDSYHQAAFILDKIKGAQEAVSSMSYWVFTDIFEEAGPRSTPFHGGFGLLNYQGIKKAAYFAYQYLARLGPTELEVRDPEAWVTRDARGGVQALVWDYTPAVVPEGVNDQQYFKRDLPPRSRGRLLLSLRGLRPGDYRLQVFRVGYRVNDAYASYRDLGSPPQLTPAEVEAIRSANSGAAVETAIVPIGTAGFERELELRENDVYLVTLDWLGAPTAAR